MIGSLHLLCLFGVASRYCSYLGTQGVRVMTLPPPPSLPDPIVVTYELYVEETTPHPPLALKIRGGSA